MESIEMTVRFLKHRNEDFYIALSNEHKGLYLCGESIEEIEAQIPAVIKALLEAEGKIVIDVLPMINEVEGFIPDGMRAQVQLQAA